MKFLLCLLLTALTLLTAAPAQAQTLRQEPCDDAVSEECEDFTMPPATPSDLVSDYFDATVGPAIFAGLGTAFADPLSGARPKVTTPALGPWEVATDIVLKLRAKRFVAGRATLSVAKGATQAWSFKLSRKAGKTLRRKGTLAVTAVLDLEDPVYGAEWGYDTPFTLTGVAKK